MAYLDESLVPVAAAGEFGVERGARIVGAAAAVLAGGVAADAPPDEERSCDVHSKTAGTLRTTPPARRQ